MLQTIKDFFADKSWPHRIMLVAIGLLFWAQFMLYTDDPNHFSVLRSHAEIEFDDYYGQGVWTGWQVNWLFAVPSLLILGVMFLFPEAYRSRFAQRFGYWLALALIYLSSLTASPDTAGGGTVIWALFVGLAAAVLQAASLVFGKKPTATPEPESSKAASSPPAAPKS